MKISEVSFYGTEKTVESKYSDDNLSLLHAFQLEKATRGKPSNRQQIKIEKDAVVEFIFEDGTTWMANPDTFDDLFPEMYTSKRSPEDSVFEIPDGIRSDSTDR